MSVLLETTLGDIVIDLDYKNSPSICYNFLKLVKVRYYTNCLIYDVVQNRYCITGDPRGDGKGGCSIYAYIDHILNKSDILHHPKRFLKSSNNRTLTKPELQQKGVVSMLELNGIKDTIGSQFLITVMDGPDMALDGAIVGSNEKTEERFLSLGKVVEDDEGVLDKINNLYCDKNGRPYTDVRIVRALIVYDPFSDEEPKHMKDVLQIRNINEETCTSPDYNKPMEEIVESRISILDSELQEDEEEDEAMKVKKQIEYQEKIKQKEAKSRAIVLEMLGDIPTAEIKPPDDVLFVCKLNPVTQDDDLELIFSRFDNDVKCEVIRDSETGQSLCYAFVEFGSKEACVEAYFKMNNALVDDRRIKVDFSQSVSKIWNRFYQFKRGGRKGAMPQYDHNQQRRDDNRQQQRRGNNNQQQRRGDDVDSFGRSLIRNNSQEHKQQRRDKNDERYKDDRGDDRKRKEYSKDDDSSEYSSSSSDRRKKHKKRKKHHSRSSEDRRRKHHKHEKSKRHRR